MLFSMVVEIKKCQLSNKKHKGNKKSKPTISCWYQLQPKPNLHVHNKLTYYLSMHDNKLTLKSPMKLYILIFVTCHSSNNMAWMLDPPTFIIKQI